MIGENIKREIEKQGILQADLARQCDITQAMMSQILRGSKIPSAVLLKKIADIIGVSVDSLFR